MQKKGQMPYTWAVLPFLLFILGILIGISAEKYDNLNESSLTCLPSSELCEDWMWDAYLDEHTQNCETQRGLSKIESSIHRLEEKINYTCECD